MSRLLPPPLTCSVPNGRHNLKPKHLCSVFLCVPHGHCLLSLCLAMSCILALPTRRVCFPCCKKLSRPLPATASASPSPPVYLLLGCQSSVLYAIPSIPVPPALSLCLCPRALSHLHSTSRPPLPSSHTLPHSKSPVSHTSSSTLSPAASFPQPVTFTHPISETLKRLQVSKLDTCDFSAGRFLAIKEALAPFLKSCGFRDSLVQWLPAVGPSGENLVTPPQVTQCSSLRCPPPNSSPCFLCPVFPTTPESRARLVQDPRLSEWWNGDTLVGAIDKFSPCERLTNKPLRLPISEITKSRSLGGDAVSGKMASGALIPGMQVMVQPGGQVAPRQLLSYPRGR